MGIFDFFGKKKDAKEEGKAKVEVKAKVAVPPVTKNKGLLEKTEVMPGLFLPRALALHWPALEKTRLAAVSITATPGDELALEQSKFGYYPCMPLDFEYPQDGQGKYMYPLAQINCKEIPPLAGYPRSGYLQFYISAFDDVCGIDFDNPQSQKDFRILYFEEHEVEKYKADFSFLDETMASENLPVYKPHALSFSVKEEYIGANDVRNKEILEGILKEYPDIEDELGEAYYDNFPSNGHKIGGYAYFTQEDPRMYNNDVKDYILLLQIDSDEEIMWGDSGVANFFIHPADLAKKDFSKVMYAWDCH